MDVKSISLGSWFPKTSLHFQEFFNFLKDQTVIAGLDKQKAKKLHQDLAPENLEILTIHKLRYIKGTSGPYEFNYFEDGLLIISGPANNLKEDREKIEEFYHKIFTPALGYLFSLGAKGLEIIRTPGSEKKVYLCVDGATEEDLRKLFGQNKYNEIEIEKLRVYAGESLMVIEEDKNTKDSALKKVITYAIFFNEAKKHAGALLQTHRLIWDDAEKLLNDSNTKPSLLFAVSQKLAVHANNVDNIQSRIEQMELNINFRKHFWQQYEQPESLGNLGELDYLFQYLENIFIMTKDFLQTNVNHLTSQYNELHQKLLTRLQFLFLAGVVVSFISLGTFGVWEFDFFNTAGEKIAIGTMPMFDFGDLMIYGSVTIFLTLSITAVWMLLFKRKIKIKK